MVDYSFIRLSQSLQEAHDLQTSPFVTHFYQGQIQLKPKDPKPYYQITDIDGGVDYIVTQDRGVRKAEKAYLVNCNGQEFDITPHFNYINVTDINGVNQLAFRLAYLPIDFGYELVYLKVVFDNENTYYSNRFLVTDIDIELTTRLDYTNCTPVTNVDTDNETFEQFTNYNSTRLQFFFSKHIDQEVSENYFQITTAQNVNTRFDYADLKQWLFIGADSWTWKRLKRAFYGGVCYIDFTRNYPTESFEFQGRIERSNISEDTFITDPDEKDTIVVADVIIADENSVGWVYLDNVPFTNLNNEQLAFL